jgi:hypothetical protein
VNDPAGNWKGAMELKGRKFTMALHIARLPNGDLTGALDVINKNLRGIPSSNSRFTVSDLHMEWKAFASIYDAKLQDGKIVGKWRLGNDSAQLVFRRD